VRQLVGLIALAGGVLIGLYGLFLMAYEGDTPGSGETYVSVGGSKVDADVFGGIAIVVAVLVVGVGLLLLVRRHAPGSS
jgi:hypothetical protein